MQLIDNTSTSPFIELKLNQNPLIRYLDFISYNYSRHPEDNFYSRQLFHDPQCSIADVLANVEFVVVNDHPLVVVTARE